jgi:hypothetical protein
MDNHGAETRYPVVATKLEGEQLPSIPLVARTSVSHRKIKDEDWKNRHFEDFNAKDTEFRNCDFRYSNFKRAYFRDAKFFNCRFDGALFSDCNFKNASFYKCDLKFVQFRRSLIELDELIASLPAEPNIRREAIQSLRANAVEVGDYSSQSRLILEEIEATKRHYSYALRGYDSYYRKKYYGFLPKLRALAQLSWLQISGIIWGHGEKPARLLLSSLVLLLLLTAVNFWSVMPKAGWVEARGGLKLLEYVVQLFLDMTPETTFRGYAAIDYIVVLMRYVYIGLFISVLYKSISHR